MNKRYFLKGVLSALGIAATSKVRAFTKNVEAGFNPEVAAPNATVTPTPTLSVSATATSTPSISVSATATRTPSISVSATATRTPSISVSATATPTRTPTNTTSPTPTPTRTNSVTPSTTPSVSSSALPSASPSNTITPSSTTSPTPTLTPTSTTTPSNTITPSISISATTTPSSTNTPSTTVTPSVSETPSNTPSITVTPSITPSASSVLPVELLYFELINTINGGILINFATTSETNNSGYEILKSTHFSNFNAIAFIRGKINSYQLETYSYEDKNVNNNDFITYQLKQNDTNGMSKIIATESIEVVKSDIILSEIFPNPTFRNAFVKINTSKPLSIELQIKNTLGFTISSHQYKFNSGIHQLELPIANIAKGLYFLNFKMNEKAIVRKLVLN